LKEQAAAPAGEIALSAPPNCSFYLSGRDLGEGERFAGIDSGEHAAQVFCSGRLSTAQRLKVDRDSKTSFTPLVLDHLLVDIRESDLTFKSEINAETSSVVADMLSVASYGRWPRVVAIITRPAQTEVLLIDSGAKGIIRQKETQSKDPISLREAGAALVSDSSEGFSGEKRSVVRAWYKDGLAWTAIGVGAAALGAGLYFGQVYGAPSVQEPWIRAMIAGGAGIMGTGVILFFIPERALPSGDVETRQGKPVVGAAVSIAF
jgi:hypothetical protein